jgi:hypothetical protein
VHAGPTSSSGSLAFGAPLRLEQWRRSHHPPDCSDEHAINRQHSFPGIDKPCTKHPQKSKMSSGTASRKSPANYMLRKTIIAQQLTCIYVHGRMNKQQAKVHTSSLTPSPMTIGSHIQYLMLKSSCALQTTTLFKPRSRNESRTELCSRRQPKYHLFHDSH